MHWSGQQQHFLQWMQALGAQEMQWARSSAWQRTLITDVHGARELHAPWMADHRGKSKSDLTSWRWKLPFAICTQQLVAVNFQWQRMWKLPGKTWPRVEHNAPSQWHLSIDKPNLQRLQWNDWAMIRQICNVKLQDTVTTRSKELLARLAIEDLDLILKDRRLHWTCGTLQWCSQDCFGHTGWWKAWAWAVQDDMEAETREGLQRLEALGYWPSW